jgi:hypothetical protein
MIPKSKIEGYELVPEIYSCNKCAFGFNVKCPVQQSPSNVDCSLDGIYVYQPTNPTNDQMQRPELPISE